MTVNARILALTKYGDKAASTRQRLLQYLPALEHVGVSVKVQPLFGNTYLSELFAGKGRSFWSIAHAYAHRLLSLRDLSSFDAIFVHCEAFPYLPSIFENAVAQRARRLIFDYDDAIFHQYDQHQLGAVRRILGRKLQPLLRRADLCICGNRYLQEYASAFCRKTLVIPTVVDANRYASAKPTWRARPVIGWMGSPSTYQQLEPTLRILKDARDKLGVDFCVIGSGRMGTGDDGVRYIGWSEESEVDELGAMDIGIMPLPDDPWARGKCGYKLIQYMACGLPVVASPVGVNSEIVEHGVNGFLASTRTEWVEAIGALAGDTDLRRRMGAAGREKVSRSYSLKAQAPRMTAAIQSVLGM